MSFSFQFGSELSLLRRSIRLMQKSFEVTRSHSPKLRVVELICKCSSHAGLVDRVAIVVVEYELVNSVSAAATPSRGGAVWGKATKQIR